MPLRTFKTILGVDIDLYCIALLLEIGAFLRLRYTPPTLQTGTYAHNSHTAAALIFSTHVRTRVSRPKDCGQVCSRVPPMPTIQVHGAGQAS
jgi:hypothetical protein